MATLSRAKSKHMYSWWWDSHISPKNSKWLQENLTDMDSKVKTMIKLIEVDEDSFARRAEMYYKKRPELMKLVEEFYRAYRALAERYDHATGVIHQAHKTMEEHQVPFMISDDGPTNGFDPPTPDELQNGAIGLTSANSFFGKENDGKGSKQFNGYGKARKGLNFRDVDEKVESLNKNENDVQALKDALAKVEAEKEAGLLQYKQTLVRLSELESYVSRGETESECLKEELTRLKAEKETLLSKYMEALEKIANLENKLLLVEDYASNTSDRADIAEKEVESMREIIAKLKAGVQEGAAKLKGSEEQCRLLYTSNRYLQSEVESLVQKLGTLWTCVEEERMRFMETETSFQSLQNLHSKVKAELVSVTGELQQKLRLLKEMEIQNRNLEIEAKKANKALDDLNMSTAMSMKGLQEENFDLKEAKEKLELELELIIDQRNALRQEIYCLKGELEGAREKVKVLEESCRLLMREKSVLDTEKGTLVTQLQISTENLEKLSERNTFLENSLFDANARFESELDKAVNAQFDIFVLQKCIHDMKDKNLYMMGFCEKLLEASRLSEELISELDRTNRCQEKEMSFLTSQTKELRTGMFRLLETLETTKSDSTFDAYNDDDDQRVLHHIGVRLENIKTWLCEAWDENCKLAVENSVLVAVLCQLKKDGYDHSAISSLRDAVASLEKHTILNMPHKIDDEDKEGSEHNQNGLIDLQEVQARIQAIEKAVIESNKHKKEERSTIRSDSDLKTRQIEVFKSQSGSRRGIGRSSRRFDSNYGSTDDNNTTKTSLSISESANELLMKDIILDRTSDYSPYGKNKRNMGSHDSVLEVSEPYRSSMEMMVEKELCVDGQQEVSKRFSNPDQDEYKRKTLERLASDVQKLTNIQIMVRDLKGKLNTTENKGKSVEYDGVENQIAEIEETISKLFGYTRKLMKKIENSSTASSFDGSVTVDSLDSGSSVRRRCLEQARRVSEKIGRVQLEVQKVQFVLIKQDTLKTGRGGTRLMERGSRTALRDYLYGGGSKPPPHRRKRTHFCGCVQPPAKG